MFDSSHWPAYSNVEIKFEASDESGHYFVTTKNVQVKNKAWSFGRYDFDVAPLAWNGSQYVTGNSSWASAGEASILQTVSQYLSTMCVSFRWDWAEVETAMQHCNVFYVSTHGGYDSTYGGIWATDYNDYNGQPIPPNLKWHCYSGLFAGNDPELDVHALQPLREAAVGTGWPPFNTGTPPIFISFVNSCDAGQDSQNSDALLWPRFNAFQPWSAIQSEDQASVQWRVLTNAYGTHDSGYAFWMNLFIGKTVIEARDQAVLAQNAHEDPDLNTTDLALYGDQKSRLKGVYNPSGVPTPTLWYRPITYHVIR